MKYKDARSILMSLAFGENCPLQCQGKSILGLPWRVMSPRELENLLEEGLRICSVLSCALLIPPAPFCGIRS